MDKRCYNVKMLKDFFPKDFTPRTQQIDALDKIEKIWSSGKRVAIGVLPTGSGKSHIAKTIADSSKDIDPHLESLIETYQIYKVNKEGAYTVANEFLDAKPFGAFVLTVTKSLQDQYKNIFYDDYVIKGKNNYECDVDNNFTAEFAPCSILPEQKQRCFNENRCPYYKNRNLGLASKCAFLNYSVFFNLPDFLKKREHLILDEAGELEEELVAKYTTSLNYKNLKYERIDFKPLKSDDAKEAEIWLRDIHSKLNNALDDAMAEASQKTSSSGFSSIDSKMSQKIFRLKNLTSTIGDSLEYWRPCQFMVEKVDADGVVFTPYDIKPLASVIFNSSDKILLMSATISDPEEYAKSLGIAKDDYEFFEIDSIFDTKKSPIVCSRKYALNFKNMDMLLPKLVVSAIELCENHKDEKGLIHTHTHKITQEFKKQVKGNPRFLFREDGATNEQILKIHHDSKEPTILVSPSLDTGVSLDDELGRFQIVCKAPYLPLGSNRIKRMFKENPRKYMMKMLDNTIQMSGRCTRSIEDYSITYILDGTLVNAIQRESRHLPKHFLERFV